MAEYIENEHQQDLEIIGKVITINRKLAETKDHTSVAEYGNDLLSFGDHIDFDYGLWCLQERIDENYPLIGIDGEGYFRDDKKICKEFFNDLREQGLLNSIAEDFHKLKPDIEEAWKRCDTFIFQHWDANLRPGQTELEKKVFNLKEAYKELYEMGGLFKYIKQKITQANAINISSVESFQKVLAEVVDKDFRDKLSGHPQFRVDEKERKIVIHDTRTGTKTEISEKEFDNKFWRLKFISDYIFLYLQKSHLEAEHGQELMMAGMMDCYLQRDEQGKPFIVICQLWSHYNLNPKGEWIRDFGVFEVLKGKITFAFNKNFNAIQALRVNPSQDTIDWIKEVSNLDTITVKRICIAPPLAIFRKVSKGGMDLGSAGVNEHRNFEIMTQEDHEVKVDKVLLAKFITDFKLDSHAK